MSSRWLSVSGCCLRRSGLDVAGWFLLRLSPHHLLSWSTTYPHVWSGTPRLQFLSTLHQYPLLCITQHLCVTQHRHHLHCDKCRYGLGRYSSCLAATHGQLLDSVAIWCASAVWRFCELRARASEHHGSDWRLQETRFYLGCLASRSTCYAVQALTVAETGVDVNLDGIPGVLLQLLADFSAPLQCSAPVQYEVL